MLTDPLLLGAVDAGELRLWTGSVGVPIRLVRRMLMTPSTYDEIMRDPWPREPEDRSDHDARSRRRNLHAVINKFVEGGKLVPDFEAKVLQPSAPEFKNLIELRSGPPRPQSRLLTYVFQPGVWIGVSLRLRSELGARDDPRWLREAALCRSAWVSIFGNRPAHSVTYPLDWARIARLSDAK